MRLQRAWELRLVDRTESLRLFEQILADRAGLSEIDLVTALVGHASVLASVNRLEEFALVLAEADELNLAAAALEVRHAAGRLHFRLAAVSQRIEEAIRLSVANLELAREDGRRSLLATAHADAATASGLARDPERALSYLQEAIHLTDESDSHRFGALMNNLGMVYQQLNQYEEAAACFVSAQGFLNDAHPFDATLALSNEGRVLGMMGDYEAALSRLEQAFVQFEAGGHQGYLAPTLSKIASCLEAAGQPEAAAERHRAAMAHLPDEGPVRFHGEVIEAFCRFLIQEDQAEEAARILTEALEEMPLDESLNQRRGPTELLARALEQTGDTAGALTTLKQLLELNDRLESARNTTSLQLVTLQLGLEREQRLLEVTNRALFEANDRLKRQSDDLEIVTATDYLTGLANRRRLSQHLAGLAAGPGPFCLIMLDIDDFKSVNDNHGHPIGDTVLQHLSAVMSACVRATDITGRWGGEEFLVILPDAALESAIAQATRLNSEIARRPWDVVSEGLGVTVSSGVVYSPGPDHDAAALLRRADMLLYQAKHKGKNRVESVID